MYAKIVFFCVSTTHFRKKNDHSRPKIFFSPSFIALCQGFMLYIFMVNGWCVCAFCIIFCLRKQGLLSYFTLNIYSASLCYVKQNDAHTIM